MLACLAYVNFSAVGNADVRKVFGLDDSGKVRASKVIRDTLDAGLIGPVDPEAGPKSRRYVPSWA